MQTPGFTQKELQAVLQSAEGQQLLRLLQADGGTIMAQAASALKAGEYERVAALIRPVMERADTARLVEEINRKRG